MKLAVFDLDGTLCDYGKGVLPEDIVLLKRLEQSGVRIVVCSGKPIYYLCGFLRQLGIAEPILIGENGGAVQVGVDLPPRIFYKSEISEAAKQSIAFFEKQIKKALPAIWCQPNEVEFSPFPQSEAEFAVISDIIAKHPAQIRDIHIFRYRDCFDFIPDGIDKGNALAQLAQRLEVKKEDIISVGNDKNDYTMFAASGTAIGIRLAEPDKADHCFDSLTEALQFILKICTAH